jgi:hypothetical protein
MKKGKESAWTQILNKYLVGAQINSIGTNGMGSGNPLCLSEPKNLGREKPLLSLL